MTGFWLLLALAWTNGIYAVQDGERIHPILPNAQQAQGERMLFGRVIGPRSAYSNLLPQPRRARTNGSSLIEFGARNLLNRVRPLDRDSTRPRDDRVRITNVEIVSGEPFGIGKVTFEPGIGETLFELVDGFQLSDSEHRVLYPVVSQRFLDRVLDATEAGDDRQSSRLTVWFLVRGDQPLKLRLAGKETVEFAAELQKLRPNAFRRLARQWWREYSDQARAKTANGELPPLVETYLVAMLARRLSLETERISLRSSKRNPFRQTMDLVFDTESLKSDLMFELMTSDAPPAPEVQPLPEPIAWSPSPRVASGIEVAVEPMATAVPRECFYLRFGSWQNQLWLKRLLAEYGGDLSRLIQLRGYKSPGADRMLDQLALEPGKWDDLFGGNVIADLAVVGTDTYVADGASIGILFQSKNDFFKSNLDKRRAQFAEDQAQQGVALQELSLGGASVTLLQSPDHSVRSYFVSHAEFHLVTTSETLARRFLETASGTGRLSDEASFRNARRTNPVDRDDTLFLFVSESFFHNLLSPKYQIELRRRAYARAAENVRQCAVLAATGEGLDATDPELLFRVGFLPLHFQLPINASASQPEVNPLSDVSLPQVHLPVADVVIDRVSGAEAQWFNERAAFFREKIGRFDPLVIALKRYAVDDQHERLAIDARIAPFAPHKYDWMGTLLGPPTADQLMGSNNDVLSLQLSLQQDFLGLERNNNFYQLLISIQNEPVALDILDPRRFLKTARSLKQIPGYVVAWPNPGILNSVPLGFRGQPDENGYLYSRLLDLWRLEFNGFAALAFDRERLEAMKSLWHTVPGERLAQARLRIGNLSDSHLSDLASTYFFWRSWESSLANVRLVNQLTQQFGLEPQQAWRAAEQLLEVKLMCPLGGSYELREVSPARWAWHSTAWPDADAPRLPENYQAAIFQWFRGMSADVIQTDDQFVVHAILDVHRNESADPSPLPSFDLFKGFEKIGSLSEYLLSDPTAAPKQPATPVKKP